jgi:hypothetical protein
MLSDFLTTPTGPDIEVTEPQDHTQLAEFLLQWWPIYLPWAALFFVWRKIHPVIKTLLLILPILFLIVEYYTVGVRLDMSGKYWCYIYGIAWAVFFPAIAVQRQWPFRVLTFVLVISSLLSFICWAQYTLCVIPWDKNDVLHIEGTGPFRWDYGKTRLLQAVSEMKNKILLTGKSSWAFCAGPPLVNFTGNQTYITWSMISGYVFCGRTHGETYRREREVNDFYDGKCDDPLLFLRSHNISAVIIWPDDNIPNDVLVKLRYQLSGYYEYRDFGQRSPSNIGIFIKYPHVDMLPYPSYMYP